MLCFEKQSVVNWSNPLCSPSMLSDVWTLAQGGEKHMSVSKYANWIDCQHLCAQHGQQRDLPCIEVGTCKLHVSFICRLTSLGFYWRALFNIILEPPIQRDATDRWVTLAAADSHSIWKLNAASEFQVTTVELHLIITVHGSPRELSLVLWALNGRVRAHIWANYPKSSRAAASTHRFNRGIQAGPVRLSLT